MPPMPWTYIKGTRTDLLTILTNDQDFRTNSGDQIERSLIDSRVVNDDLWTVWDNHVNGVACEPTIRLDTIDYNERLGMWGHAQYREGDGRLLTNTCPVDLL